MSRIQACTAVAGAAGVIALVAASCDLSDVGEVIYPGDDGTFSTTDEGNLLVRFETPAPDKDADYDEDSDLDEPSGEAPDAEALSVETACGSAYGIRVGVADAAGKAQVCEEMWASVSLTGDLAGGATGHHYVADCLFVVSPGLWSVNEMSAIDDQSNALSCCSSDFPQSVDVSSSLTSEVSGEITCETVANGGLDIYAYINRPPQITKLEILPSKFGRTCEAFELNVEAIDPEGDGITFSWSVIGSPQGAQYDLRSDGSQAAFASSTLGDFTLRVTAMDDLEAAHTLDFPLHVVEQGDAASCDVEEICVEVLAE